MTRQLTSAAMCAKEIRKELKTAFSGIKFSVTSSTFSMGNSVDINWTNGPTREAVETVTKKYQYGHFNGMEDIYEYSNSREELPQAKFVMTQRDFTPELQLSAAQTAHKHYGGLDKQKLPENMEDMNNNFDWNGNFFNWYNVSYQILNKLDLTGAVGVKEDDDFESGAYYEGFKAVTA